MRLQWHCLAADGAILSLDHSSIYYEASATTLEQCQLRALTIADTCCNNGNYITMQNGDCYVFRNSSSCSTTTNGTGWTNFYVKDLGKNIKIEGGDLADGIIADVYSVADCKLLCTWISECIYYTWNSASRQCTLKSSSFTSFITSPVHQTGTMIGKQ